MGTVSDTDIEHAPDLGRTVASLFRQMARAKARMFSADETESEHVGAVLLGPLSEHGPLRSSVLAECVYLDPSRVSRMIAHLVEVGYVERRADPADGRATILAVTAAGEGALGRVRRRREEFLAGVVADWSEHERRQLAVLLDRFTTDLAAAERDVAASKAPQPQMEIA